MTDGAMIAALLIVVGGASLLAVTAPRLRRTDDLPSLENWSLADRGLGPVWTWFLLGGTIFTAYTFTAVPGQVYGRGASAFFALPYTVIVCPMAFVLLPRLWAVARRHGYLTVGDFVRGRYGSPALALVVALTGILATMPYLALQVLGIRAVLAAAGLRPRGATGDLTMVALFAGLAIATYRHGLRAPTVISALKGWRSSARPRWRWRSCCAGSTGRGRCSRPRIGGWPRTDRWTPHSSWGRTSRPASPRWRSARRWRC